jgi:hypothetical protein
MCDSSLNVRLPLHEQERLLSPGNSCCRMAAALQEVWLSGST